MHRRFDPGPVLAVGLLFLLTACAGIAPEPPRVRLADVRLIGGGLLVQELEIDLRLGNPNNVDLPLEGLTFQLEVNDRPLAEGYSNEAVVLPRLSEVTVPVRASVTLLDFMHQIMALGQDDRLSYRLAGRAFLSGFPGRGVPFAAEGDLGLVPAEGGGTNLMPL